MSRLCCLLILANESEPQELVGIIHVTLVSFIKVDMPHIDINILPFEKELEKRKRFTCYFTYFYLV